MKFSIGVIALAILVNAPARAADGNFFAPLSTPQVSAASQMAAASQMSAASQKSAAPQMSAAQISAYYAPQIAQNQTVVGNLYSRPDAAYYSALGATHLAAISRSAEPVSRLPRIAEPVFPRIPQICRGC